MKRTVGPPASPMPRFISPCLATLATAAPEGDNWVHEVKFDGYRLQARIESGKIQLLTRSGLDWTKRFGAVAQALATMKVSSAIIDGEALVENEKGVPDFSMLVGELKAGRSARIVFVAFDLLYLNGSNVMSLPLSSRKDLLHAALKRTRKHAQLRFSEHIVGNGEKMLAETCKLGLEGIVSKQIDKPYRSGRHGDWTKAKCIRTDEFVVCGYLNSTALTNAIGALVLGFYSGKRLIYAGRVGTGFNHETAGELWKLLHVLRAAVSPFTAPLDAERRRGVIWVKPKLVAQIDYRAWTDDGLLRHASFKAVRDDKRAIQVKRPR